MNIQIHSVRFDADKKLLDFIDQKVKKLGRYYDQIIGVDVFLRLAKSENTENKIAEIKLDIPVNPLFAKKQSKTFEEAVDLSIDALKIQITRQKEKLRRV
jgi:putative sigma-54 modulation protein